MATSSTCSVQHDTSRPKVPSFQSNKWIDTLTWLLEYRYSLTPPPPSSSSSSGATPRTHHSIYTKVFSIQTAARVCYIFFFFKKKKKKRKQGGDSSVNLHPSSTLRRAGRSTWKLPAAAGIITVVTGRRQRPEREAKEPVGNFSFTTSWV